MESKMVGGGDEEDGAASNLGATLLSFLKGLGTGPLFLPTRPRPNWQQTGESSLSRSGLGCKRKSWGKGRHPRQEKTPLVLSPRIFLRSRLASAWEWFLAAHVPVSSPDSFLRAALSLRGMKAGEELSKRA